MLKSAMFVGLSAGLIACAPMAMGQVVLENATTRVTVNGGAANNGLIPSGGYFDYFDKSAGELASWSIDPILISPTGTVHVLSNGILTTPTGSAAVSTATTGDVLSTATTTLIGTNAQTVFDFSTSTTLEGWKFLFYTENDLFSASDDVATFTGSIATGDLNLFMFDSTTKSFFVRGRP